MLLLLMQLGGLRAAFLLALNTNYKWEFIMESFAIGSIIFIIAGLIWAAERRKPPAPKRNYNSPFSRTVRPEYVYMIGNEQGGPTKIGMTRSDPYGRLKSIQTGNPKPLGFRLLAEVPDAFAAEAKLHRHFASKRLHGEWFDLSDSDIREVRFSMRYA